MKEDWNMEVVSPLFHGNFEFKDLISDWEDITIQPGEQTTFLNSPDGVTLEIPSRIIFEPTVLINNFSFWVNGNYNFSKVSLKYTVSNGAPFHLNFQMRFSETATNMGPVILPPPFEAAEYDGNNYIPKETVTILPLNETQLQSFISGEMVQFQTWFNPSELTSMNDTFLSNYPVKLSIVLYGELKAEL